MLAAAWGRVLGPWRLGPGFLGPTPYPAGSQRQGGEVSGSLPQLPTHRGLTTVPPSPDGMNWVINLRGIGRAVLVTVHNCCSRGKTYRNRRLALPLITRDPLCGPRTALMPHLFRAREPHSGEGQGHGRPRLRPGSPALPPTAVMEAETAPRQRQVRSSRPPARPRRSPRPLTVSVPLGPGLHALQVWRHQQCALESQGLALPPEGDSEFLNELDVKVRVRDHGRQGHCTEQRARSRPGQQAEQVPRHPCALCL